MKRHGLLLGAVTLGVFAYAALTSLAVAGPIIAADEFGYLANARALIGRGRVFVSPLVGSYPLGYSLLLAPVSALAESAAALYRATLLVNALLLAGLVPATAAVLTHMGMAQRPAIAVAALVALHPSLLTFSHLAFSENLFVPLQVAAVLCLLVAARKGSGLAAFGFGAALAMGPFVRVMGAATALAGALLLVAWFAARSMRRLALLSAFGALVTVTLVSISARGLPGHQAYGPLRPAEILTSALTHPGSLLQTLCGQLVSITLSTWLLFPVVLVGGVHLLRKALRERVPPGPVEWAVLFTAVAAAGTLALSAIFTRGLSRADHAIFARYNEALLPIVACAGLQLLRTGAVSRRVVGLPALGALVLLAACSRSMAEGPLIVVNVCALFPALQSWGLRQLPLVALLYGGAMLVLWRGLLGATRQPIALAAVLVLELAAGLDLLLTYHRPGSLWRAQQARFLLDLEPLGDDVKTIAMGRSEHEEWARGVASLTLPRAALTDFVAPEADLIVARKDAATRVPSGYRLVTLEEDGPLAAWLRHDIAAAGGLFPITTPGEISDYRASLDLLEPLSLAPSGIHVQATVGNLGNSLFPDLRVFAEGPWPVRPVRLGLRFLAADGDTLGESRLELPQPLRQGQRCVVSGTVAVPHGARHVILDLVHEGRRWFGLERRYALDRALDR